MGVHFTPSPFGIITVKKKKPMWRVKDTVRYRKEQYLVISFEMVMDAKGFRMLYRLMPVKNAHDTNLAGLVK